MPTSRRVFLKQSAGTAAAAVILGSSTRPVAAEEHTTFAIMGDYGTESHAERQVANMIASWSPNFVATTGDNVYSGEDRNAFDVLTRKVGRFYGQFVDNGTFYPALGNHDWGHPGTQLLDCNTNSCWGGWSDFFTLPGNGRYFDVRHGPVHLFVLDDYYLEPDGNRVDSAQADWLRTTAAASDAPWKIATHHQPAWGSYQQFRTFQWPFQEWGIDAVFCGHIHAYERLKMGEMAYVLTGAGGANLHGDPGVRDPNQRALFTSRHGASRGTATATTLRLEFVDIQGVVQDQVDMVKAASAPPVEVENKAPTTTISAPQNGSITDRSPRVQGWATAPQGVGRIDLILKNTDSNQYWNEQTGALQRRWRPIPITPERPGEPATPWLFDAQPIPAGRYMTRAWTRSTQGNGDPQGTPKVNFIVR